jgi:hypothetical protein
VCKDCDNGNDASAIKSVAQIMKSSKVPLFLLGRPHHAVSTAASGCLRLDSLPALAPAFTLGDALAFDAHELWYIWKQTTAPAQLGSPTSAASTPMLVLAAANGGASVVQKAARDVSAGST